MIEAGILNGDYVVVNRTNYVDNGDIAVVLIGDEATVKTFYRENGCFRLQPENRDMTPIITNEVYILGKVIANIRYY
jgi:repressor LexA